jgi:hypothetical protein
MTSISKFDSEVYSEEAYSFTEAEYDEVMSASAVEDEEQDGWQAYGEWSAELEQAQFEASLEARATVQTASGPMLLKRECNHSDCEFSRCKRSQRIGGIDV